MKHTTKIQHHLISMDIVHDRLRVHGLLRCDNQQSLTRAAEKIVGCAEAAAKELGVRLLPVIVATALSPHGMKVVHDAVLRYIPEAEKTIREAGNFYLIVWFWEPDQNPDDAQLMALH